MVLSTLSFIYLNYFSNFVEKIDFTNENKNYNTEHSPAAGRSPSETMSKRLILILLLLQTCINCLSNGILPGIQIYSVQSYGAEAYHWSVLLNLIFSPLVMYIAFFVPFVSIKILSVSMVLLVFCTIYEILTAVMRPPPMAETNLGVIFIVSTNYFV